MGSFADGLTSAIRQGFCAVIDAPATAIELMKQYSPLLPGDIVLYNLPRALYRNFCDREPPPDPSPGFTGGQCDTRYDVYVRYQLQVIATGAIVETDNPDVVVNGSVKGLRLVQESPSIQRLYVVGGLAGNPGAESLTACGVNSTDSLRIVNYQILNVVRVDGNPDNCGNAPSPIPPYTPGSNVYNTSVTYNSGGTSVTVPVGLVFGYANVNLNGYLTIPVKVSVNLEPQFVANFNLSTGDITFDFGGGSGRNPNSPDQRPNTQPWDTTTDDTSPPQPDGTGVPNPPKPSDPSADKVIIGCLVTVTSVGIRNGASIIGQDNNPDIYAPNLGFVNFLVPANGIASGWTPDQPIKNRRCYIPCPAPQGAIRVDGTFRTNVTGVIQPVYAKKNANVLSPL